MAEEVVPNGTSDTTRPQTPALNSLSLTEYAANPSPTAGTPAERAAKAGIPESFLLPNGYPDVSERNSLYQLALTHPAV